MDNSATTLSFPLLGCKPVTAEFDGGRITSNGGMLLLAKAERKLRLCSYLAEGVIDNRQASKVRHTMLDLLRERIFAIASGYEDANDLNALCDDPAMRLACNRGLRATERLASQPTMSRMENSLQSTDVMQMALRLAEIVVEQLPRKTQALVIDVDASEDPCHGQQQFEIFNGHYNSHCYLPLFVHVTAEGDRQRLLCSLLRPGNASSERGFCSILVRAIGLVKSRHPEASITLRGDAGFGHAEELHFCEDAGLDFVLGLSTNSRLKELVLPYEQQAEAQYAQKDGRLFAEFQYQAGTWDRPQRVIARIEVNAGRANTRFVMTNLTHLSAEEVYEFYCGRGEQENRIKELKLDLKSDRTSCHSFLANQLRLILHTAAGVLLNVLQDGLKGTRFARCQMGTMRLRLLKVGAHIKESTRAIRVRLSSAFVDQDVWRLLSERLTVT